MELAQLDKQTKKQIASDYTQSHRPMGVYQIRNVQNDKIYVDGSVDLVGAKNRFDFYKQTNLNMITELQKDWATFGGSSFVFEELDRIKPREDEPYNPNDKKKYKEEVDTLLQLWLDKLQPYGDIGYNRPKRNASC
ncbi:MAG: hypothetical protein K0Q59_2805 [Paenibacillus sp.]|jgi:hypothetical protein|nr:hypothetical protein [Paenibacillus sp.]